MIYTCAARFDVTESEKIANFFGPALFSSKIFYKISTVIFSFVFDKYCSIMD